MARVLAIGAHPDDTTLFAGGTLRKYAEEGHEVYVLCTTRGEGGEVGEPPVGPAERLGALREAEERCADKALGAREVFFLDYVDPHAEIGGELSPIDVPLDEFAETIAAWLDRLRPNIIMTHGSNGEYGHPQHVYTHQAVWKAIRRLVSAAPGWRPDDVLTWCANYDDNREDRLTNVDDPADIVLWIKPWIERKIAAAECHHSQHAMIRRNSGREVQDAVRRVESFRRWLIDGIITPA